MHRRPRRGGGFRGRPARPDFSPGGHRAAEPGPAGGEYRELGHPGRDHGQAARPRLADPFFRVGDSGQLLPRDSQPEGRRAGPRGSGRPARQRRDRQHQHESVGLESGRPRAAGRHPDAGPQPAVSAFLPAGRQLGLPAEGQVSLQHLERPDVGHGPARADMVLDPGPGSVPEYFAELRDVLPAELRHHAPLSELPLPHPALARNPGDRARACRCVQDHDVVDIGELGRRSRGTPTAFRSESGPSPWGSSTRRASRPAGRTHPAPRSEERRMPAGGACARARVRRAKNRS